MPPFDSVPGTELSHFRVLVHFIFRASIPPTAPWHRGEAEFELSSPSERGGGLGSLAPLTVGPNLQHTTHCATETRKNKHASPRIHRALFVFWGMFMGFWKFLCRTLRARLVPGCHRGQPSGDPNPPE